MKVHDLSRFAIILASLQIGLFAKSHADDIVLPMTAENFGRSWERLDGPAGRIISAVVQVTNNQLTYQIHSPSHSFKAFLEGRYTCVSPDAKIYYDASYDFIESEPFRETEWVVVSHQNKPPIDAAEDLKGKRVGLLYDPEILRTVVPQEGVVYDVYGNLATNLRKLEKGRLDAVIVPKLGLQLYVQKTRDLGPLTFDPDRPLAIIQDRVLCHNTPRGQEVISIVNAALGELKVNVLQN